MRFARTASALAAIGGIAAAGTLALTLSDARANATPTAADTRAQAHAAAAQQQGPSIFLAPSVGAPGSRFTIIFTGFDGNDRCQLQFLWDDQKIASHAAASKGSVEVTVPNAAPPGPHEVSAYNGCRSRASSTFWVVVSLTVTRPAPPTTTVPPPRSTVPPSTTTTTTTTITTTTTAGPPTTTAAAITTPAAPATLTFDRPSIQAGEPLTASGTGCDAGAAVTLTDEAGRRIGTAVADAAGRFTAAVEFTSIEPGRNQVTATCGAVLTGSVDVVLTSSTSGNTGTVVVVLVFLLAAAGVVGRTLSRAFR
jgi:hypothetical protein